MAANDTEAPVETNLPPDSEAGTLNASEALVKVKILSDKVELLIPKSFGIMTEEIAKTKYPSENRPTLVYTNENGSVNIAFSHTESEAKGSDIPEYMNVLKKSFENLYPSAQWYKSEIENINGKDAGILELLTPAIDTEIYNLILFTNLDGKLLIATFNCTSTTEQMNDWKQFDEQIIYSINCND